MAAHPQVLIVGAGPTGLVLALSLLKHGVAFRIVDDGAGPGERSRAIVVQARTLELYDRLGLADEAVARGTKLGRAEFREGGLPLVDLSFADLGEGLSPYPFALILPQDDHERFLVERLEALGGRVEWNTRLVGFEQSADGVRCRVAMGAAEETLDVPWLVGCDGAHSVVRKGLKLDFPGGAYAQPFYVADVKIAENTGDDLRASLGEGGLHLMFPVRSSGMKRLIGIARDHGEGAPDIDWADVRPDAEAMLGVTVTEVNWFSAYRVHHRVAERFRVGRVLIAGDAGHIHSPAGGQGMNTGIGDAVNLAWRLAEVTHGAPDALLDAYEAERLAFARTLVATTDRAFRGMTDEGAVGRFVRGWLAPRVLPRVFRSAAGRRTVFRTVSQIGVSYRRSGDGEGQAGAVHAGDRLPWTGDNFEPLRSADWQLHVYGEASSALAEEVAALSLPLHTLAWTPAAEGAGLARDATYLIRPDAYVGWASAVPEPGALTAFFRDRGLRRGAQASVGSTS